MQGKGGREGGRDEEETRGRVRVKKRRKLEKGLTA